MRSRSGSTLAALGLLLLSSAPSPQGLTNYSPVTDARLTNPEPENWLMTRGNYQGWSYSPLDQINTNNVKQPGPGLERTRPASIPATRRRRSSTTA